MNKNLQRRDFLKGSAAFAAFTILPSTSRAVSPNSKLRTAHIGVGGKGRSDLSSIASHPMVEVAALCDVDLTTLNKAQSQHPHAKPYRDYRALLTEMGDSVDAVVVSTPDHTHAPAAMAAMNDNKPVYCQKPLTHEVFEARQLRLQSEKRGLATQMGIQVHSSAVYRRAVLMIRGGVIGKVSRVYAWSHKNWGYDGGAFTDKQSPPANLDWNLWLDTAAMREFVPKVYHPGQWRKIVDFGTGTLGDMGVHIFDTPYGALDLAYPKSVRTTCRTPTGIGHPEKNVVEYEFPGTAYTTASLIWRWYDGAFAPPNDNDFQLELPRQGSLFVGEEGAMLLPHVGEAKLYPEDKFRDFERPQVDDNNHYHQWVDACLGKGQTSASFSYGGKLTEALLLGVVANRFPNTTLNWDADNLRVTNLPEANKLLKREYRDGFQVEGL